MRLGYSTNSIGDIAPLETLPMLRDLGYESLAITPDRHLLDPFSSSIAAETARWRSALAMHGLACVIETGARHLLDPLRKHEPTLVSPQRSDRERRIDFLVKAVDLAAELGAPVVSLWSGAARDAAEEDTLWRRLTAGLGPVLDHAANRHVHLGFEPEPGMFIDTLSRQALLHERLGRPQHFKLTVDLGHLECMGERPAADLLAARGRDIVNVHVDDMLACRHEHL
ncbi:sugar phosphate isomerase/epimerase, partial [bacterium]|nr:sugar phosphate isomerase/epimerase [bacterium]